MFLNLFLIKGYLLYSIGFISAIPEYELVSLVSILRPG